MGRKLYKYIGPAVLEKALSRDGYCSLKCSYPKDYNDPYELFLSVDLSESTEMLAFYKETINEIPQNPTTCFSNSPIVIPMWAHYGHSSRGYVLEFDEEKLRSYLKNVAIEDITYRNSPDPEISSVMHHAYGTVKPRHTYILWNKVYWSAYFTKHRCWSYEQEIRLVVQNDDIERNQNEMLIYVPNDCVTFIICGAQIDNSHENLAKTSSESLDCNFLQVKTGKSSSIPYFVDSDNKSYIFSKKEIKQASNSCVKCKEPIKKKYTTCSWCSINEGHEELASLRNAMGPLFNAGLLEEYLRSMGGIGKTKI